MDRAAILSPHHLTSPGSSYKTICFTMSARVCQMPYHQAAYPMRGRHSPVCFTQSYPPLLGIQLSSIQMHNRSQLKQTRLGHTLPTQATAIISTVFSTVHTAVVSAGPHSDFPWGSPQSALSLSLSGVYFASLPLHWTIFFMLKYRHVWGAQSGTTTEPRHH